MNSIKLTPRIDELYNLNAFIEETLSKIDFQVELILEEIFVNIVNYSNTDYVNVNATYEDSILTIEFIDNGVKFNPILKENHELPENIKDAEVGGLGIHLTKELSDELFYEYTNDENHLKIIKKVE